MDVVSATDIIPHLYDDASDEERVDDLSYDVYNLAAFDHHAIRFDGDEDREEQLHAAATAATQLLIKKIFTLPTETAETGPVAVLPEEVMKFPREKRIPEPKPETKWEKFAREKGIKKTKRERMIFDEETQTYKPRFGYKGINQGIEDHAIVEVKPGQDPYADPWSVARQEKKERIHKNVKHQMRNIERNLPKSQKIDPAKVPGIPLMDAKAKKGKDGVRQTLQLVQHSTASMGRYDNRRQGEPEMKIKGKKRHFADNVGKDTLESEKKTMKSQIRIVADKLDKKLRGVTNSLAPYEGILPDAPTDSYKQKKGKGRTRSEEPAKKRSKR